MVSYKALNTNKEALPPSKLGSNRTFMELKFSFNHQKRYNYGSSNRTFMELK